MQLSLMQWMYLHFVLSDSYEVFAEKLLYLYERYHPTNSNRFEYRDEGSSELTKAKGIAQNRKRILTKNF